jgi:ADP-heptose:LPS heptosyltransferase
MKVKILIIRLSSIGDIVLTSLVVRCLKNQVKNCRNTFCYKTAVCCILKSNPYIHKVHVLEENFGDLMQELTPEKFDYIIDLHHNFRSARLKRNLKAKTFSVNKLNWQKMLLIRFKINRLPQKHIVDRYLETTSALRIENDGKGLDYFIPEKDEFKIADLPLPFQNGFVAFVIAGTYKTKKLPVEKISEICRKINFPVILLGGKKEFDEGEKVFIAVERKCIEFCRKNQFKPFGIIGSRCQRGSHQRHRVNAHCGSISEKNFSFWGNTVADFGMVPYQPHPVSQRMEVENLKCRPCSKLGFQKCPKKHFKCMNDISVDKVVRWVEENFES